MSNLGNSGLTQSVCGCGLDAAVLQLVRLCITRCALQRQVSSIEARIDVVTGVQAPCAVVGTEETPGP